MTLWWNQVNKHLISLELHLWNVTVDISSQRNLILLTIGGKNVCRDTAFYWTLSEGLFINF